MDTGVRLNSLLILLLSLFALAMAVRLGLYAVNIRHLQKYGHQVPEEFTGIVDQGMLQRMRDYTIATIRLGAVEHLAYDFLIVVLLLSGLLPLLAEAISLLGINFVFSGVVFFFVCSVILGLFEIPFDLFRTFEIEKRFSFNTTTYCVWFTDLLKSITVSALLTGIFLSVFFGLIMIAPKTWWFWSWMFFISFQLLISWLYPVLIAPLFNKFEPIQDEELLKGIHTLAERSGITVKGIYKMDALKRSRHSNAYFTGIGKSKRIVLFDTLLQEHTREEILAVLAHELGHWKLGHIRKQLLLSVSVSLLVFFGVYVAVNNKELYTMFGFPTVEIYAGLFLLTILIKPVSFLLSPLGAMISRHFERQADYYAYSQMRSADALISALKQLATQNLSNLHPAPIYAWFTYTHPPLTERIRFLETLVERAKGPHHTIRG